MAFSAMPVIAVATAKTKARSPMNVWIGIIADRKFMGNPGYKNAANPATHCFENKMNIQIMMLGMLQHKFKN